jgi:DNA-binding NarL/FixJ family response regulator
MDRRRILVVDDHTMFREGMRRLLQDVPDFDVVGEAVDGSEAVNKARSLRPHVVLMDVRMPGCNGIEATATIKGEMPETKVVILTVSDDEGDLVAAVKAGADGYIAKTTGIDALIKSIRGVMAGEAALSRTMTARLLGHMRSGGDARRRDGEDLARLSDRELEIMRLVASGVSNREIASRLFVSESTVRTHLHNILGKLGLENRVQITLYALREHAYQ